MIFLREVIFYTQFSIIFIMIRVSKNICFKIIGSHDTLNIIVICKTYVATEPIYRIYCGVCPLSPDFKDFSVFFSLVCNFLSPKFLFLSFLYSVVTFFCLNFHFFVFFTLCCDFFSSKFTCLCFFYSSLRLFVTWIYIFVCFLD